MRIFTQNEIRIPCNVLSHLPMLFVCQEKNSFAYFLSIAEKRYLAHPKAIILLIPCNHENSDALTSNDSAFGRSTTHLLFHERAQHRSKGGVLLRWIEQRRERRLREGPRRHGWRLAPQKAAAT